MGRRSTGDFSIEALMRIIKKAGASRISVGAAKELGIVLEEHGNSIAIKAQKLAEHAGRKTIRDEDIRLASQENRFPGSNPLI